MAVTARDENRVQLQVSIPRDLKRAVKLKARAQGMKLYALAERALRREVER